MPLVRTIVLTVLIQPLLTILKAHDFPPTTLRFNTASNLLVSGSADNTVRVVTVPASLGVACKRSNHVFLRLRVQVLMMCGYSVEFLDRDFHYIVHHLLSLARATTAPSGLAISGRICYFLPASF